MKILVVCLGNICRSPMAHGILEHLSDKNGLNWTVDSAGTESYHVGEAPHPHSQKVCKEHGIDISKQRARKFTHADITHFDKVYAMAGDVLNEIKEISGQLFDEKKVCLFLDELFPGQQKSVKDPWYGNLDGYYEVYDEIEKCCEAIVKKYS